MNDLIINRWNEFEYSLSNNLISKNKLLRCLVEFRNNILKLLPENHSLIFQLKVKLSTGEYRSISKCYLIKGSELIEILDELLLNLEIRLDAYNEIECSSFIITYKIFDSEISTKKIHKSVQPLGITKKLPSIQIAGFNLPRTMDITTWGDVHFLPGGNEALIFKYRSKGVYTVKINKHTLHVELKYKDKVVVKFTDILLNTGDLSEFKRRINNHTYYFKDGKVLYKEFTYKKPYIPKLGRRINYDREKDFKVITMDLETRSINGKISPYACSIYDGKEFKFFYLSDYENSDALLKASILHIMTKTYNKYTVYLHNFSKFDGIFLVKVLTELSNKINIIMRDSNILNVVFHYGKNKLHFKDSYLMLPLSLKKLAKSFNVEDKGIFPYKFVDTINLDYDGPVPEFKYFEGISEYEYNNYVNDFKNRNWNLRNETEFYCNQDVLILYKIIFNFTEEVFNLFDILVISYTTLSSLAFAIFRSNYMKEDQICTLDGKLYIYGKESYRGGYVDVFRPSGKNIRGYDVNSLYPYIMRNNPMPVGQPTFFKGDILQIYPDILNNENKFLLIKVEIESPSNMDKPFILKSVGTNSIAPLGKWHGIYTSTEIIRALELNYKIKIIDGVIFNTEYIFKDYVDELYKIKSSSKKDSAWYLISKLLLNSLYGRFAINPNLCQHKIIEDSLVIEYFKDEKYIVEDIIPLSNDRVLIRFVEDVFKRKDIIANYKTMKSNISIAAAVTAGARTFMQPFITEYNAYYTDTDSIYTDQYLPEEYIGNKLGQFKLEHQFDEAVFLCPKVYGGINSEYELTKVKGLKNPVKFNDLKNLLSKDNVLEVDNEKWYRNLKDGVISVKKEIYSLMLTANKRHIIFDKQNKFISTKPFNVVDEE